MITHFLLKGLERRQRRDGQRGRRRTEQEGQGVGKEMVSKGQLNRGVLHEEGQQGSPGC